MEFKDVLGYVSKGGAYALAFMMIYNFGGALHNGGRQVIYLNEYGEMLVETVFISIWLIMTMIYWCLSWWEI